MNIAKPIAAAAITAFVALTASSQSLNKEISVERDILPEYREASRLRLTPVITLPALRPSTLTYSFTDNPAKVSSYATALSLPTFAAGQTDSCRGYIVGGIMPAVNAALSAGYRLIDNASTALGAQMQFNNIGYHSPIPYDYIPLSYSRNDKDRLVRFLSFDGGLNLTHRTGEKSILNAAALYSYSRYDYPFGGGAVDECYRQQGSNRFNANIAWRVNDPDFISGGLRGSFERFAYIYHYVSDVTAGSSLQSDKLTAPREGNWRFGGDLGMAIGENGRASIDVDFSSIIPSNFNNDKSSWLLRLRPAYSFVRSGNTDIALGALIDLTHGSGKSFHIAPDVTLSVAPSPVFKAYAKAGGGEVQNTLSSLYAASPYVLPVGYYRFGYEDFTNSHVPITVDAGIVIGPFNGFYAELFAGYARANDWCMPKSGLIYYWKPMDVKAAHGGIEVGYLHGNRGEIKARVEIAENSKSNPSKTYYLWRDRAGTVVEATGRFRIIPRLEINGSYTLRAGRHDIEGFSLGTVSDLGLGVTYSITRSLTAFLNGTNLLNRTYTMLGNMPSRGISGLAGVSYKF